MTENVSDETLAEEAARGDAGAFGELYGRYRNMVYALARRTLGNDADAEDALQATFVKIHRALPGFRGDAKLSTWIWSVATSVALSERRSRRRRPGELDAATSSIEPADPGPPPGTELARADEAARVRRHLEALPRRERAILHLRYSEGKSFDEIAEILGMPAGTAKSLVFRAKAELRGNMERDGHAL